MNPWEKLEEYLFDGNRNGEQFTSVELALDMNVSRTEASGMIQSYLAAQTGPKSATLFVLHRTGRTRAAVWHVGVRKGDVLSLGHQTGDDFRCRLERHINPTLARIGNKNPRAMPAAEAVMQAIDAGVKLIESMLVE